MHHTSRKDEVDEEELPRFWIFSLLLSNFFISSVTMHTEEVSPRRNSKSGRDNQPSLKLLFKAEGRLKKEQDSQDFQIFSQSLGKFRRNEAIFNFLQDQKINMHNLCTNHKYRQDMKVFKVFHNFIFSNIINLILKKEH